MKSFFLSVSFLVVLGLALSQHLCPPPNLIKPCECTNPYWPVTYSCDNITDQETLIGVFNKSLDYPLHALVLNNSTLLYLPTALMRAKNVTILLISHCTMSAIFDEPVGTSYEMQMFQVIESLFQRGLDWDLFKGLKIGQIHVERTDIKRIGSSFLQNIEPTVTEITFDKARISSVQARAFANLSQLKTLVMSHNNIKGIRRSMFANNLRLMDFSWNKIPALPDDIFHNMPALTDVFLDGNRIKTFPAHTWERLMDSSLSQVTLADNPIVCDCGVKWYTKKRRSIRVTGKCAEPENLRNYNLIQLTPGDFAYCPK